MAKFAIISCILLLAVSCDAQIPDFTGIVDTLTDTVSSYVVDGQERLNMILEGMSNATSAAAAFETLINSTIQEAITEYHNIIASIAANGTRDVTECISTSVDFEATAEKLAFNTISCVENTITTLLSNSTTTLTEFRDALSALYDIGNGATSCISNAETSLSCVTELWSSMGSGTASDWIKLMSDAAILVTEFSNIEASIATCGLTTTSTTLASEAQKSYNMITECIDNLN